MTPVESITFQKTAHVIVSKRVPQILVTRVCVSGPKIAKVK